MLFSKTKIISMILERASNIKTRADKIAYLKGNLNNTSLIKFFDITFNESFRKINPNKDIKFTPSKFPDGYNYSNINKAVDSIYYILNGNDVGDRSKELIIQQLETISSDESSDVIYMLKGKINPKYKGITKKLVEQVLL